MWKKDELPIFAQRLRECRKNNNLSVEELCEKIGAATNTIYQWENGSRECGFKTLLKLAFVLDETPNYLLGWDEFVEQMKLTKEDRE